MKLLIVEDEHFLAESMESYLKKNYQIEIASSFAMAQEKILNYHYDCILLDITLPDGNGLQLLKLLKNEGKAEGVIIISAKNSLDDKISGLELGADDYLTKPFHLSELSARISSLIRRRQFSGNNLLKINDLDIDLHSKIVRFQSTIIDFTKTEYELFLYLIANKNRVVSKNAIAEHISGDQADFFDNYDFIYTHIKNIKKKMTNSGAEDHLKSIYGMGYKYEVS